MWVDSVSVDLIIWLQSAWFLSVWFPKVCLLNVCLPMVWILQGLAPDGLDHECLAPKCFVPQCLVPKGLAPECLEANKRPCVDRCMLQAEANVPLTPEEGADERRVTTSLVRRTPMLVNNSSSRFTLETHSQLFYIHICL